MPVRQHGRVDDAAIGAVLDAIDEAGLDEDTIGVHQ